MRSKHRRMACTISLSETAMTSSTRAWATAHVRSPKRPCKAHAVRRSEACKYIMSSWLCGDALGGGWRCRGVIAAASEIITALETGTGNMLITLAGQLSPGLQISGVADMNARMPMQGCLRQGSSPSATAQRA